MNSVDGQSWPAKRLMTSVGKKRQRMETTDYKSESSDDVADHSNLAHKRPKTQLGVEPSPWQITSEESDAQSGPDAEKAPEGKELDSDS